METSLLNRMQATLLAIATLVLFVLAVLNLQQQQRDVNFRRRHVQLL